MENKNKEDWINKGYELVAEVGFDTVNIEYLSRFMNKNKSSFYHYFGDLNRFTQELLDRHISNSNEFAEKMGNCVSINPDLLNLAIEHKSDIFFHKQLRINRNRTQFKETFQIAFSNYENAVIHQWAAFFGMEKNLQFVRTFIHFFTENLLLKATFESFTFPWLEEYLEELATMMKQIDPGTK